MSDELPDEHPILDELIIELFKFWNEHYDSEYADRLERVIVRYARNGLLEELSGLLRET